MFADLHMHTIHSDGTNTPYELCTLAKSHGIQVISITDHDTIAGHKALSDEQTNSVRVISGIEISTEINRKMLHILGYYIDIFDERLERFIHDISVEKTETTRVNFEAARESNVFEYKWERVLELNRGQPRISGPHVVNAMKTDGYEVPGMGLWDMFRKCFWPENDNYLSNQTFTAYDAIDIIKAIGGIPVIAHPKTIGNDDIVLDLIRYGAQGIEVYHPKHTAHDTLKYLQMAENKKIYVSGGTDWHGENSGTEITQFGMCGLKKNEFPILDYK